MNDYDDLPEEENNAEDFDDAFSDDQTDGELTDDDHSDPGEYDRYEEETFILPRGLPLADGEFTSALEDSDSIDLGKLDLTGDEALDIEAALESVASLSDVIAEQEAEEAAEQARQQETERRQQEAAAKRAAYYLPRPPLTRLERGQLSSVIPALLLMLLGAGLTLVLTADDVTLQTGTLALVGMGGIGALMLAQWISSARWAGGALFGGLSLLFTIGIILFLQSDGTDGWPLLLCGIGLSAMVSALLAQPLNKRQPFLGVLLMVAGGIGYVLSKGMIDFDFTDLAPVMGIGVLAFALILFIAPVIVRR